MKRTYFLLLSVGLFVLVISAPWALRHSRLRLNSTDSVPIGIYLSQKKPGGSFAGICLANATLSTALAAGLKVERGECPSGYQAILKPVYRATPQSPVEFDSKGFTIGGVRMPNTKPKEHSRSGKPLEHYGFGVYKAGLWAISEHSGDSYDSRYFGPVSNDQIRFYAEPLVVF